MGRLIGIDLGTTNSCAAFMENGQAIIIPNAEGGRTTPSVVAFNASGDHLIGEVAKRQAVTNAARTVQSVKREMGTDWKISIDGTRYSAQQISAMILQKLKADAEQYIGEPVTDAVITVPAYFTDSQRQATKDAGRIAGLNVQRIINEPTSAALAYGIDKEQPQKIMVYDLGGGTFDVSILDISSEVIEVLATAGNNHLGGDDFDKCIMDWLVAEFKRENRIDLTRDVTAMQRVREAAEKAKIELSASSSASVSLPFLAMGREGAVHMEATLTRAKFNELTAHLVDATRLPVRQALNDAGLTASQLGKVLLVGGSTRIPAVQEAVREMTGKEPFRGINPDECVAMGACIQGGVLSGAVKGLLLIDVTPLSLGIETVGDVFARVIDRNTSLPAKRSQVFTTAANFQTSVEINVLQGEREIASANKSLGKFKLNGIRRAMRGVPQIEVTFAIDTNGIVNVSARDLSTGNQQDITISGSGNMSQRDIDEAIREAAIYAERDKQKKEHQQFIDRAENLLNEAKHIQRKLKKEDRFRMDQSVKQLEEAIRSGTDADISRAAAEVEELLKACGRFVDQSDLNDDGTMDAD